MIPAAAIVGGLVVGRVHAVVFAVVLGVVATSIEHRWPRHAQPRKGWCRPTDLAFLISRPVLELLTVVVGFVLGFASLAWVPGVLIRPTITAMHPAARVVVAFFAFDFAAYWAHRFVHRNATMRRFHAVHHSSEQLDWLAAFRSHPLDGIAVAPAFSLLIASGFSPKATGVFALVRLLIQAPQHMNVGWRLPHLGRVIVTPEFHHWHHDRREAAHDRNFGSVLAIWDWMFGTAIALPGRPSSYGIDHYVTSGFAGLLVDPVAHAVRSRKNSAPFHSPTAPVPTAV